MDHDPIDPSALTTQQLLREINSLEGKLMQRMDAIEKAVEVAHENLVRVPTEVDKSVGHLRDVMLEKFETTDVKFKGIYAQFLERDIRRTQSSQDQKIAIEAAFQAAKEAVAEQNKSSSLAISKSEASTTKQIDQLETIIKATSDGINRMLADLKERLTRLESEDKGERAAKFTQQTSNMSTVSIIGLVLGSIIGVAGIVIAITSAN